MLTVVSNTTIVRKNRTSMSTVRQAQHPASTRVQSRTVSFAGKRQSAPAKKTGPSLLSHLRVGASSFALLLVAANVLLGVWYIFGINRTAAKEYELTARHSKIKALQLEQKKITVQVAEQKAVVKLNDQLKTLGFIPVTSVDFYMPQLLSQK